MEQTFKIQVSDGCSAKIEQQDGFLVVVFEQQKKKDGWAPNDGDIIVCDENEYIHTCIIIYAGMNEESKVEAYAGFVVNGCGLRISPPSETWGIIDDYRPATDAEKQRLFDALAKEGKRWNAETKRIEDLPRWRAKEGEKYYFVSDCMDVDFNSEDSDEYDDSYYAAGNYFKTEEAAERAAEKMRKILKESEAE